MASNLRPRSNVNYKALNEGESVSIRKSAVQQSPQVLEGNFKVERIIFRRKQKDQSVSIISLSLSLSKYENYNFEPRGYRALDKPNV